MDGWMDCKKENVCMYVQEKGMKCKRNELYVCIAMIGIMYVCMYSHASTDSHIDGLALHSFFLHCITVYITGIRIRMTSIRMIDTRLAYLTTHSLSYTTVRMTWLITDMCV